MACDVDVALDNITEYNVCRASVPTCGRQYRPVDFIVSLILVSEKKSKNGERGADYFCLDISDAGERLLP